MISRPRDFPSTRFQGSKRKLVGWIAQSLQGVAFSSVLDVFGGTGTLSYLFKRMGKEVIFNDLLKCNCITATALVANDRVTLSEAEIDDLCRYSRSNAKKGFVSETFKGLYFTDAENLWIDYILGYLQNRYDATQEGAYKKSLVQHALFQTLLCKRPFNLFHRNNLYLRRARVTRSFGNKTTWETPTRLLFRRFLQEANQYVFEGKQRCSVLNLDATELPEAHPDLVYLDPPYLNRYGNNETADYRTIYHFIEGISHSQSWPSMVDYDSSRKVLKPLANPWIRPKLNRAAFDELFYRFRSSILVISYKSNGVPSVSTIRAMLRRHGRNVRTTSKPHQYALRRRSSEPRQNREVLIIAE